MKRIALIFALCASLSACGPVSVATLPLPPSAIADAIKLDEQAALGAELAYQGAVLVIRAANRAGLLDAARKRQAADLDEKAYKALKAMRLAYDAGNSASYTAAVVNANSLIAEILNLVA